MDDQKPYVGATVIVRDPSNGQGESGIAPAIVNRVWSPDCINVTVLPDCGTPYCKTSLVRAAPKMLEEAQWQWPTRE